MIANQGLDAGIIKNTRRAQRRGGQRIVQKRAQSAPEPIVRRHVESHLFPVEDRSRQLALHQLPQDDLLARAVNLEAFGKRRRELDDAVIERRGPYFARVRPAHTSRFSTTTARREYILI